MQFPNFTPSEYTPPIKEGEYALWIRVGMQAGRPLFAADAPWPMFGAFQIGRDLVDEFGMNPNRYLLLVVSHKESRAVFAGGVLKDVPAGEIGRSNQMTGGVLVSTCGVFNVDLKVQCGISPKAGKYWAMATLGKLASPVVEFEVR